jgi:hypothetical protein
MTIEKDTPRASHNSRSGMSPSRLDHSTKVPILTQLSRSQRALIAPKSDAKLLTARLVGICPSFLNFLSFLADAGKRLPVMIPLSNGRFLFF